MFCQRVCACVAVCLLLTPVIQAAEPTVRVELDVTEVPDLTNWGEQAKTLIQDWYPRTHNLLLSSGFKSPDAIALKIEKSDKGIAATLGNRINVSSHWIEKHPDDIGLVFHEMVHVIQQYPPGGPGWVTEGVADYLRWGIYEGKDLSWFPRPPGPQGYKRGYQIAGGFLLWLESDKAPGIVRRLNTAMRQGKYSDEIFQTDAGTSLDDLWNEYVTEKKPEPAKPAE